VDDPEILPQWGGRGEERGGFVAAALHCKASVVSKSSVLGSLLVSSHFKVRLF